MEFACDRCGARFKFIPTPGMRYYCTHCMQGMLNPIPANDGDPVRALLLGAGVGAAIGSWPGAIIGGILGLLAAAKQPSTFR